MEEPARPPCHYNDGVSNHGQLDILNRRRVIIWTNDDLFYWRIYASLGFVELTHHIEADWNLNLRNENLVYINQNTKAVFQLLL